MNKKIYMSALVACMAVMGMNAQQQSTTGKELSKEITLEKDFVPVEKKVTKKNTLPKVKKVTPPAKTNLDYSDTPVNIEVPTTIPTMMPYGYRTAHNFSDKRGYLVLGGGLAANFDGAAGYRFADTDNTQAGIWVQHNSTWAAKNRTPLFSDEDRLKQQFNDNRLGLYLTNYFTGGTLKLDAGVHFDSFNYYGARKTSNSFDTDEKQSFLEFNVNGGWNGKLNVADNAVDYRLNVGFNHAGYDLVPTNYYSTAKGASENLLNFGIGGDYILEDYGTLSLDLRGDYVNYKSVKQDNGNYLYEPDDSYFLFTVAPRYKWENDVFRAEAGVDLVFGDINIDTDWWMGDRLSGSNFHIAPAVKLDIDIVDGAAIFVDVKGGNTINSMSHMASLDRYSDPTRYRGNTWRPVDGEFGFKIGPFSGFSAKLFGGYGMAKGQLLLNYADNVGGVAVTPDFATNSYQGYKMRGFKMGAELNYKYRSVVEAAASVTYAPGDDALSTDWVKGYSLGLDGARLVGNIDLKVNPMRQLAVNLGMDYRGERRTVLNDYTYSDMDDAFNLYAGASWRFDKVLSVWAKASNLLNRRYDILPGQGAQGINAMLGINLVF